MELRLEALAFREAGGEPVGGKGSCPDDELFGAFMEGRLSDGEAEAVAAHLEQCPRCARAFGVWREAEKNPAPAVPPALVEEAEALVKRPFARVVLRFLERALEVLNPGEVDLLSPDPALAAAPCRGEGDRSAKGTEVVELAVQLPGISCLRIQSLEAGGEARVTVFTEPSLSPEEAGRMRLDLHGPEGLLQSWPLEPGGTVLSPLQRGTYRLVLSRIEAEGASAPLEPLGTLTLDLR